MDGSRKMMDPLTALDDIILDQFEKVVIRAGKKGKTKYDLSTACYRAMGAGLAIFGFSMMTAGAQKGSLGGLVLGGLFGFGGLQHCSNEIKKNAKLEDAELALITRTGACKPRYNNFMRPVILGIMGGFVYAGLATEATSTVGNLLNLSAVGAGVGWSSDIAGDYFRTARMNPPKSEGWLTSAKRWVSGKYAKLIGSENEPIPEHAPAKNYQSL